MDYGFNPYNTNKITCRFNDEENLNKDADAKYCGRIKYHYPKKGGYLFDKNIFSSGGDFYMSNEYFGSGGSAHRLIIL